MTAPAPQAAEPKAEASAPTGDSDIWLALMESYKNRLTPDKRAFVGQADDAMSSRMNSFTSGLNIPGLGL